MISLDGSPGTFYNRSIKQTAVSTSSTHAEARAIFTLAKELNFLIALLQELNIPMQLPAIIMEDNSAVVTMSNNDTAYAKKCKHFLMVLNYVKEQISIGQIEARKIYGKLNNADLHTKPLRCPAFAQMADKILGQPTKPTDPTPLITSETAELPAIDAQTILAEKVPSKGMDAHGKLKRGTSHRSTDISDGAKRRKLHAMRFVTSIGTISVTEPAATADPVPGRA
jgi:hypothetical protein